MRARIGLEAEDDVDIAKERVGAACATDMYYGGQHFMGGAAAGVLNSYADGVNVSTAKTAWPCETCRPSLTVRLWFQLHSDGLSNEPKRSHLAHLHATLLAHADTIMATDRPIPQHDLGSDGHPGLAAFVLQVHKQPAAACDA